MRNHNSPLISVIVPESQEGELTVEWAAKELEYIPHEIITAPTWVLGLNKANGQYICFLEKDCVLMDGYFDNMLDIFESQTAFRKLVMVAPAIGVNSYENKVYGYRFGRYELEPSFLPSSTAPYLVQLAYLPGALIRRSALGFLAPAKNALEDSATACIYFWDHGQRVVLDPNTLYISTDEKLAKAHEFENPVSALKHTRITDLFRRERIS